MIAERKTMKVLLRSTAMIKPRDIESKKNASALHCIPKGHLTVVNIHNQGEEQWDIKES